ncbi:MAG: NADP-dependent oxidoreductase [Proteobacteria bacterium]|nr:NADP-dependent oxidoreductase [Pseudomonadota bacterium]
MQNRGVIFMRRPEGPVTPDIFDIRDLPTPEAGPGDVVVRNIYLSCDPYMRGRFKADSKKSFQTGRVIPSRAVAQVVASNNPAFRPGDYVWGFMGWELYSLVPGGQGLRVVDPALGPLSHAITVRGMPGLTAQVGIMDIGKPSPGETCFVSAASGAVGQVAGQIARLQGCRVVGSAGSAQKIAHVTGALGFDAAFNYKTAPSIAAALEEHCPDGIDIYFDNVGGETLEAVIDRINPRARIAVCGQISGYDSASAEWAEPRNLEKIALAGAVKTRFSVYDHMDQYDAFVPRMAKWLQHGDVVYFEDIWEGIGNTPEAFIDMMKGGNLGKRLVRVAEDQG